MLILKLRFAITFLFISCSLFAQQNLQDRIDSLSVKVKHMTGEPKLEALAKLAELEIYSTNLLLRVDELEREAKKQRSDRFLLSSYNYGIMYYIRTSNHDSISFYTNLSAPIAKRLDPIDAIVTKNELLKAVGYTTRGLFDLALMSQKKYLEEIEKIENVDLNTLFSVYVSIGDTYYHQEKYNEALKSFVRAKDLMQTRDWSAVSQISTFSLIALCHVDLKDYATAIDYFDLARSTMNTNKEKIATESYNYLNFMIDLIAIRAYSEQKDFKKAKELVDDLPSDFDAAFYQDQKAYYYTTLFSYYAGINEYDKALEYIGVGIDELKKDGNIISQPVFIKEKAALSYNMHNYKEAYDELLNATLITDSIRNSYSSIQLDELNTMYEVVLKDTELAKAQSQLRFTQTVIIALIVISILLLILLLDVRANSRRQKAKNKVLFKQQEKLSKSVDYYKKMVVNEANENNASNIDPLFQKLESYMLKEEAYKQPDINREDISAALNTNRQYLSSAIKETTGLTFTSYINQYRLENARKLLLLESNEVMIDDIIIESGFSSRSTFHRLFKEQYGMAPHELKRAAIALKNEIIEEEEKEF